MSDARKQLADATYRSLSEESMICRTVSCRREKTHNGPLIFHSIECIHYKVEFVPRLVVISLFLISFLIIFAWSCFVMQLKTSLK